MVEHLSSMYNDGFDLQPGGKNLELQVSDKTGGRGNCKVQVGRVGRAGRLQLTTRTGRRWAVAVAEEVS